MTQQVLPFILGIHLVSFGVLTIYEMVLSSTPREKVLRAQCFLLFDIHIYIYMCVCKYYAFCSASSKVLNTHTPFTYYFIFQHILFRDVIKINKNNIDILTTDLDIMVIKLIDINTIKYNIVCIIVPMSYTISF